MEKKVKNQNDVFRHERDEDVRRMAGDLQLRKQSIDWMIAADRYKYTYNFTWMGRPIIKFPNDMVVQQELMWSLKPDLIIETGIAHGGSIIFTASMMEMMGIEGEVVGIDIDIREHNKVEILNHPMYKKLTMYEGSSTDPVIIEKVAKHVVGKKCVMVILDSLHSHEHVLNELQLYSKFVTLGSYIVLPDTFIEFFPKGYFSKNRPWDVGDNPYTAMKEFLKGNSQFEIDKFISSKAVITESIDGYLKKIN
jgi:cephalosporin hydroxylase